MKKEQIRINEEYNNVLSILNNMDEYMIDTINNTVKKYR